MLKWPPAPVASEHFGWLESRSDDHRSISEALEATEKGSGQTSVYVKALNIPAITLRFTEMSTTRERTSIV